MPAVAFGTWKLGNGQGAVDHVDQALSLAFVHVGEFEALNCSEYRRIDSACSQDTAQACSDEEEAGQAL